MPSDAKAFGDSAILAARELGHPLCVGLDPHLGRLPQVFRPAGAAEGDLDPRDPATAEAVERFLAAIVDRVAGRVAVVKPQIAFFEQLGWPGMRALAAVCERARRAGLLVLLDAKRGDIGSTADGYARSYLEPRSPLPVDAITLNPYLGLDSLEPFAERARAHGRGLFVLVKTSNPGSGDFQDRSLAAQGGGEEEALFVGLARALAPLCAELRGEKTGWSSLGAVVGATYPEQAEAIREALPDALFLVPGYGAQGATAAQAVRGFRRGPRGLEGGLVNSSRGVLFPDGAATADAAGWERAIDDALTRAIEELGEAVGS